MFVIREKNISEKQAIVEGVFHQMEDPFGAVMVLGNDIVDALVGVEASGEKGGDECAVGSGGFDHDEIKLV